MTSAPLLLVRKQDGRAAYSGVGPVYVLAALELCVHGDVFLALRRLFSTLKCKNVVACSLYCGSDHSMSLQRRNFASVETCFQRLDDPFRP